MEVCICPLIAVRMFFTVSVYRIAGGITDGFAFEPIRKDGLLKEIHSPSRIRPPPMTVYELERILC
jgi:hypothetical protein